MPDNTSSMKEDQKGPKNREIIQGLGYSKNTVRNGPPGGYSIFSGWVVTCFLLGYTVRMFEYTVRTFWSNVGRFLYVFSSMPRKLYTIFQPTFSPIKRYQDSICKLLTLSTNSVTNVVRTAYFQIQADLRHWKFCDRVCTQSKKLYEDILASLDREKWGLENGV